MKPRPLDIIAILFSLAVVAAFSVRAYAGRGAAAEIEVQAAGGRYLYRVTQDRVEHIPGPLGDTVLVIRGGAAWVEDSPCRDKICVAAGRISRPGEWVACLPNRVMVSVGGRDESAIDGTVF